jgi:RHS repeat-associated protein
VVEQYEYDPFGKATVYTAAGALVDVGPAGTSPEDGTRSAYGLTHLYKAMRLDPETGNCYVRNRFYDPRTGRFMSRDPIGVWGDAGNMGNEYAYAWNRPLVVGDPLGLQGGSWFNPISLIGKGVEGLGALAANSGVPLLQNVGRTVEDLGSGVDGLGAAAEGVLTLDGEQALDGLGQLGEGALGVVGLGSVLDDWVRPPSGSSVDLPKRWVEEMEVARERWKFTRAKCGAHNWHAGSNYRMAARAGITELPWLWLGGLAHEVVDVAGIAAELRYQGLWVLLDSPLDVASNTIGMISGLLLPKDWYDECGDFVGRLFPWPNDPGLPRGKK